MGRKFLIIDDSALMRRVISDIIKTNSEYEVLDVAVDGVEGFDKLVSHPNYYDMVILDINMPKMNGLELLEMLQKHRMHEAVVVVSTVAKEGTVETIRALELGALDFVTKPENFYEVKGEGFRTNLLNMIKVVTGDGFNKERLTAAPSVGTRTGVQLKNVITKDKPQTSTKPGTNDLIPAMHNRDAVLRSASGVKRGKGKVVALACSTGGPKSLQHVIPLLPKNLDAGVVLVQHMPKGFTVSLAQRLDTLSEVSVKEAEDGDVIQKGHVYIAPGGKHLLVERTATGHVIKLSDAPAVDGLRPCANNMYNSLVNSGYDEITCVVLTGMGADGTKGIKALKENGRKIYVIGQDAASCVVYGMPRSIAEAGLVNEVRTLDEIAESIVKNVGVI